MRQCGYTAKGLQRREHLSKALLLEEVGLFWLSALSFPAKSFAFVTSHSFDMKTRSPTMEMEKKASKLFLDVINIVLEVKQLRVNGDQSKSRSGASRCSNEELKKPKFLGLSDPNSQNERGRKKPHACVFLSFSVWLFAAPSRTWQAAASRSVVLMSHLSQQDPSACWRSKRDRLFELCR